MLLAGIVLSFSGKFGLGRCGAAVEMGRLGVRKATSVVFQGQFGGGFEGYGEVGRGGSFKERGGVRGAFGIRTQLEDLGEWPPLADSRGPYMPYI